MVKKPEDVGAEFLLDLIKTVDDSERAALDAIRRFVTSVDKAFPRGDKKSGPRRQVEVVEAALKMIEQLLAGSNEVAQRLTQSVRDALPEIERNASAAAKRNVAKAPAKKAAAKKAAAKKAPAKKAPAKKAAAKKTPAKRKAPAKKAPAKRKQAPATSS